MRPITLKWLKPSTIPLALVIAVAIVVFQVESANAANETTYVGVATDRVLPNEMSKSELEEIANDDEAISAAAAVPLGYALRGGNRTTDYNYRSGSPTADLYECTDTCVLQTRVPYYINQNVTGGSSKNWVLTMNQGIADNPGRFSWSTRWVYYCGVNRPVARDPECENGAYPSGEDNPLSLGTQYTRRFEATVSTGINYPLVNIVTQFSTGTVVELKFRGWDTCLSATNVQLCATSDG